MAEKKREKNLGFKKFYYEKNLGGNFLIKVGKNLEMESWEEKPGEILRKLLRKFWDDVLKGYMTWGIWAEEGIFLEAK